MSKPSLPQFRMPAVWIAAVAVIAIAVAGLAVKFSALPAKDAHALNPTSNKSQAPALNAEQRGRVRASLDALPLAFVANQGQTDPRVKYTARGNGYSVFLTSNDAVFAISSAKRSAAQPSRTRLRPENNDKIQSAAIDMRLVGGNSKPEIAAGNELPGIVNYYVGSDPKNWHTGVKQYSTVSYREVYPGVNMVFHGAQRQLEFDFVVSPGADPKPIALGFKGARKLNTDESGNLVLTSSAGDVVLHKPVAYQEKDGKREIVEATFQVKSNEVALNLGPYDRMRELVIDPSLTYATYLGGTAEDDASGIAIDGSGDAYVTGQTKSTNFPTVTGAYAATNKGGFDIFVSKIAANGASLIYSTYIGGSLDDSGTAIAVDGSGNAYVAGGTLSNTDFPTHNGFQSSFGGAVGTVDGFVLELASSGGSLVFSTYLGGSGNDVVNGIAVDTTGVYVAGSTTSTDFPLQGALQGSFSGHSAAFVTKLQSAGNALAYSTYLGGGNDFASGVAVASGNAYVTGTTTDTTFPVTSATAFQPTCGTDGSCNGGLQDAFVTVLNSSGASLVYSTYLGGEGNDQGLGIAVDSSGDAYVTGLTESTSHFPLKSALQATFGGGTQDAFVAELNPSGTPAASTLVYSTYLGGSQDDSAGSIAVDGNKNAYVTGTTNSPNFPTAAATQSAIGGQSDGFVSEISTSGSSLVFSTYLGGALNENINGGNPLNPVGAIAVDSAGGNIYVAGNTASSNFPATAGALQIAYALGTDAFVAKYATGASSNASFTVANGALSNTSGHAGVSATATITVGSTNGFNSAVQLACTVSPVVTKGPTCSFSNPSNGSVTPPANGTATATFNVATTTASAMLAHPNSRHSGVLFALILPMFGIAWLSAGSQLSGVRRRKLLGLVILGIVLTMLLLLPACGGSSNNNGGGGTGTPTGTYTFTVTGTSGTTVVTGTPALTLTIN